MCFSSLLYSTAMVGSLSSASEVAHRKNPPTTEVDARLILTSRCLRIQPKIKLQREKY